MSHHHTSPYIDHTRAKLDTSGIWIGKLNGSLDIQTSKKAWEEIYSFDIEDLYSDRERIKGAKLSDHMNYVEQSYSFSSNTSYLEIGCGPAHIGVELMRKYGVHFIGVDFNYPMLLVLKNFFDKEGLSNYTLVHADITQMPLKNDSIDYIYGGGVIEHLRDTAGVLIELYRVLNKGGVSFNTVPAFNCWWPVRCYRNIPSLPILREIFEFIHYRLLQGKLLEKNFGYELSYTPSQLRSLHRKAGFAFAEVGPFSFHLSVLKTHRWLNELIYKVTKNIFLTPVYYVSAKK
jgi:ubiquinone/menaquinone biosynthesis C-methylase UbiE